MNKLKKKTGMDTRSRRLGEAKTPTDHLLQYFQENPDDFDEMFDDYDETDRGCFRVDDIRCMIALANYAGRTGRSLDRLFREYFNGIPKGVKPKDFRKISNLIVRTDPTLGFDDILTQGLENWYA